MGITISKKFSILAKNTIALNELNLNGKVSQLTANVDYFYRSAEAFEACAELEITISQIEIEVDIGGDDERRTESFDCEQYCAYFGLNEDEFVNELKSDLESAIRDLDIPKIIDGEEVKLFEKTADCYNDDDEIRKGILLEMANIPDSEDKDNAVAFTIQLVEEGAYTIAESVAEARIENSLTRVYFVRPNRSLHENSCNGLSYYNYEGTHFRVFKSFEDGMKFLDIQDDSLVIAECVSEEELVLTLEKLENPFKIGRFYLTVDGRVMEYVGILVDSKYLLFNNIEEGITLTYEPNGVARAVNHISNTQSEHLNIKPIEVFVAKVKFGKGGDARILVKSFKTEAEKLAYIDGLSDMDGYTAFELM